MAVVLSVFSCTCVCVHLIWKNVRAGLFPIFPVGLSFSAELWVFFVRPQSLAGVMCACFPLLRRLCFTSCWCWGQHVQLVLLVTVLPAAGLQEGPLCCALHAWLGWAFPFHPNSQAPLGTPTPHIQCFQGSPLWLALNPEYPYLSSQSFFF